ncbi:MAG TPA: sigma-70 family RNA polymerase sigma factor [Planctomycetota bacterium]|nr:sigma-70 family RNA polymerase sigma factor [Planctomycetota bacterium]
MAPDPVPPVPLERLLEHRTWVRSLARALVRDPWDADDLEQDLWLASMETPPAREGAVRRWFRVVARHAAGKSRRGDSRRLAREEKAARPEAERPTAEVVAEADALRRVVVAVMDLEEPYRAAVLLRWFEDLPPAAIAARQGVPVETVRTRLRRAVERLRERLDEEHRGDRKAWVLAFLPLTGREGAGAVPASATAGAFAASAVAGGILMAKKAAVLGAAALLLAAGVGWLALRDGGGSADGDVENTKARGTPVAEAKAPNSTAKAEGGGREGEAVASAPRVGVALEVLVRDSRGAPLPGVQVTLHPFPRSDASQDFPFSSATAPAEPPAALAAATTGASGRVRLDHLEPGERVLGAAAAGRARAWRAVHLDAGDPGETVVLTLLPACTLSGRVRDADGRPVPGVFVVASGPSAWKVNSTGLARAAVDAEGRYRLEGLEPGANTIRLWTASGQRRSVGWIDLPGVSTFDIDLDRGATVRGRVLDDATGEPVASARVFAWATADATVTAVATTGADGTFAFDDFPPWSLIPLTVDAPGYLCYPDAPGYAVERVAVRLSAGTVVEKEIRLRRGRALRGRITGPEGAPIAGVRVSVPVTPQRLASANSGADGAYGLEGLPPGAASVRVVAKGWILAEGAGDGAASVDLAAEGESVRDFVLARAPSVEGRVVDGEGSPVAGARVEVRPGGQGSVFTAADGTFLATAAPGSDRTVAASASAGRRGVSAPFTLERNRGITGIDVRLQAGVGISGTLRREDGGRLEGAELRLVDAVPDPADPWNFDSRAGAADRVPLDDAGGFRIEGLPPGKRTLIGVADGCAPTTLVLGDLASGTMREGVELLLRTGAPLEGRVSDPEGGPVPGARVRVFIEDRWRSGKLDSRVAAVTDDEGRFRCGPLPLEVHRVLVTARGFQDGSVSASPGGERVALSLERTLAIGGVVLDADTGRPVAGVTVAAVPSSEAGPYWSGPNVSTGADGAFRIEGVTAGSWTVRACVDWTGSDYIETLTRGVAAGTLDLRIEARKGLAIAGRVVGPEGGLPPAQPRAAVRRKTAEGELRDPGRSGWVKADGSFRIGGLSPGEYELSIDDGSGIGKQVFPRTVLPSVAAGTTDLVVKVVPGLRIAGRVVLENVGPPSGEWNVQVVPTGGGIVLFATTKPDGSFVSPPLPEEVPHDVIAAGPPGWPHIYLERILPGKEDLVITLRPGKTLEGRVLDETGAPVPAGVPVMGTVTKEDGLFAVEGLKDRPWRVTAGGPPSVYAPAAAEAKHSPGDAGVVVTVRRGVTLSGRVVGPDGTGLKQVSVIVEAEETAVSPGCWYRLDTDASGNFAVTGLPPGPVKLRAQHPRRGDVDLGTVQVPATDLEVRFPE